MSTSIIVLGATGDLSARYLLPALAQISPSVEGGLHLIGVSQDAIDEGAFRQQVRVHLGRRDDEATAEVRERLAATANFISGDVTDSATLARALALVPEGAATGSPVVLYLALPHVLFRPVVEALGSCELPAGTRIVVEKPFGADLDDARELNAALAAVLPEELTFRVDHFLAKQTVLNLLGLRFANRIFEPLWNNVHIAGIDILFDETVDAQDRSSYYDRAGALRDMVQNHLLQLLTYVAMEPPLTMDPVDLSRRKVDVLRAVRTVDPADLAAVSRRGRYAFGTVADGSGGRDVAPYVTAAGVDPSRETETYAEVTLHIDNWRWAGVPFRLRTGKALDADRREVVVRFAPVTHEAFRGQSPAANELRLQLDPDRMSLKVNVNGIGEPFELETIELDADLAAQDPGPYGQLLLAVISGDTRLSAHALEAEEGWRIVGPILEGWAAGAVPLEEYPAGSTGPRRLAVTD